MLKEEWRPIPGFHGYSVSNMGQVASHLKRSGQHKWEIDVSYHRILRPSFCRGYAHVNLRRDNKSYNRKVAFLVLLAFIGERPPDLEVCHNNGIKSDNRLENLRYDTRSNKARDIVKHGRNNSAKLLDKQVLEIRKRRASGERNIDLAIEFGITTQTVSRIVNGKTYRHVGGPIGPILSGQQVEDMRRERISGVSLKQLASKYKISESAVSRITLGNRRQNCGGPKVGRP